MSTLSPLTNLTSSLHLHPLPIATSLLTLTKDALFHFILHSLLLILLLFIFTMLLCTQPLPLYLAYSIIQHFRTLKAENANLKIQLEISQQERDEAQMELAEMPLGRRGSSVDREMEVLEEAKLQLAEEMEVLVEMWQGFRKIVREFETAVRELPGRGFAPENGDDDEDGSVDAIAGEIDADGLALMHPMEWEAPEKAVGLGASREVFEKLMSEAGREGEVWVENSRKRKLSEAFPRPRCY